MCSEYIVLCVYVGEWVGVGGGSMGCGAQLTQMFVALLAVPVPMLSVAIDLQRKRIHLVVLARQAVHVSCRCCKQKLCAESEADLLIKTY